jgi:hypothetical protein
VPFQQCLTARLQLGPTRHTGIDRRPVHVLQGLLLVEAPVKRLAGRTVVAQPRQLALHADELGALGLAVVLQPVGVHQPGHVAVRLGGDRLQQHRSHVRHEGPSRVSVGDPRRAAPGAAFAYR